MRRTIPLVAALLAGPMLQNGAEPARDFAVVVHRSNPTRGIRLRDLASLFGGTNRQWPNNSPVVLVERDAGSPPFRYLMGRLLNTTPGEYKRSLQNIEYRGNALVSVKILNSDAAACEFVFNVPTAIAIIETTSLATPKCGQIQAVRVKGKWPGEEGYRLR